MATQPLPSSSVKSPVQSGAMPPLMNRIMTWLLRSPLHRVVSSSILTLTFTGLKSGKSYTTPLSYTRQGEDLIVYYAVKLDATGKPDEADLRQAAERSVLIRITPTTKKGQP